MPALNLGAQLLEFAIHEQVSVSRITDFFKRMVTKVGGALRDVEFHDREHEWSAEPAHRQRLDHFGHGGEGWDSEGWEAKYASPLRREVQQKLDREFGAGKFNAQVGEKGHLYVLLTPAGKTWLGAR